MKAKTNAAIEKFLKAFVPPEGFTKIVQYERAQPNFPKYVPERQMILTNGTESIRFEMEFRPTGDTYGKKHFGAFEVEGHTHFELKGSWVSFDRTGVSSSFYAGEKKDEYELSKELLRQLDRIKESRERAKSTVALPKPLSGWSRTTAEIEQIKAALRQRGYVEFLPSGFGTGYRITARRRSSYASAVPEVAKFLGFPALYAEQMDCD